MLLMTNKSLSALFSLSMCVVFPRMILLREKEKRKDMDGDARLLTTLNWSLRGEKRKKKQTLGLHCSKWAPFFYSLVSPSASSTASALLSSLMGRVRDAPLSLSFSLSYSLTYPALVTTDSIYCSSLALPSA